MIVRKSPRLASWLGLAGTVSACGGAPVAPAPLLTPPAAGQGLQLAMQVSIGSGQEATFCQAFVLPAGATTDVERFEHVYSAGSHHMVLYRTALAVSEALALANPVACTSAFQFGVTGIAYAAQLPAGEMRFPPSVAMRFGSEEVLVMETHYLNTSAAIDAEVRVNLWFPAARATTEAGALFFYDPVIVVPANGTSTAQMQCEIPSDVMLLSAASHMHRRGVGYRSSLSGGSLPAPLSLFETTDWDNVALWPFDPPIAITAGQRIDYACDYRNDTAQTIIEGPSAEFDEMCMFIGAYYPRLDFATEACRLAGSGPVLAGTQSCAQTLACWQSAVDPIAAEECAFDTCAPSSRAFNDFNGCVFTRCRTECSVGAGCSACIGANCATEYTACQSATCI